MKCHSAACFVVFTFVSAPMFADSRSLKSSVGSPVERVVNLLKDLHEKLGLDGRAEQQVYDKYACWCEKTTDRKANDISVAQDELRSLGQSILSLKGKIATLAAEIEELTAQIKAIKKAMDRATNIRQKENAAFLAETAEMKQAIIALQQAITVLASATMVESKSSDGSLLQASIATKAGAAVKAVIAVIPARSSLNPGQFEQLGAFLQSTSGAAYMPQSLTVQGILTDMYKTFAADLESAYQQEADANRKFEDFMNVKETEKNDAKALRATKEGQKADAESQLADIQQIYDDTAAQKAADIKFFDATKAACLSKHDAWTIRKDLRMEEIAGITQALDILTDDANRELFATTIKAGKETGMDDSYNTGRNFATFLQVRSSSSEAAAGAHAYETLKAMATETHSFRLAALAARVKLTKAGHFDQVIAAITTMINTLTTEGQEDIAKRDQCKEEYQKIKSTVKNVTWLIEKNVAKIDKLERAIKMRKRQRDKAIADIAEVDETLRVLKQEREEENEAFENSKLADQSAIDVLISARTALIAYYKKHNIELGPIQGAVKGLALAQRQAPDFDVSADQAPEAVFSSKGKRKDETKGIVQIMTMLIEDINDEIKNDMKAEEVAQLKYEGLRDEGLALKSDLIAKKTSLEAAIAKRGQEKQAEEADKLDNENDLQAEQDYKASITNDCDFIIRTFTKRATAREAEMRGLTGAKEFLVGANPSTAEFVQRQKVFDDRAFSSARFLGLRG